MDKKGVGRGEGPGRVVDRIFTNSVTSFRIFSVIKTMRRSLRVRVVFNVHVSVARRVVHVRRHNIVLINPLIILQIVSSFGIQQNTITMSSVTTRGVSGSGIVFIFKGLLCGVRRLVVITRQG